MGCRVSCRLCGMKSSLVVPDSERRAAAGLFLFFFQFFHELRALLEQRRQVQVAARDRARVMPDFLRQGIDAPLQLVRHFFCCLCASSSIFCRSAPLELVTAPGFWPAAQAPM